jgi:hypothetical protein
MIEIYLSMNAEANLWARILKVNVMVLVIAIALGARERRHSEPRHLFAAGCLMDNISVDFHRPLNAPIFNTLPMATSYETSAGFSFIFLRNGHLVMTA